MNLAALQTLIAQGESETLELKRSTAELKRAGETLCAFLNGEGGKVLIGVAPDGKLVGQEVADITLRDIAAMLGRFEPPARVEMSRVDVENGRQVIVLEAVPSRQFAPFVFESKPYKRVGSTTTVMSQEEYARVLLDRNHSQHRWENQPAVGVRLEDLDREEILRTRAAAIEQRRLSAGTSMDASDILDRLGLRIDGQVTQAAQMLQGPSSCPTTRRRCSSSGASGARRSPATSSTTSRSTCTRSRWSARPSRGSTGPCRCWRASRRAPSTARTVCRCPRRRCARSSSTPSSTAT